MSHIKLIALTPRIIDQSRLLVFKASKMTRTEGISFIFMTGCRLKDPSQKNTSEATRDAKIDTGMKDIQRLNEGEISFLLNRSSGKKRGTNVTTAIPAINMTGCSSMAVPSFPAAGSIFNYITYA